MLQPELKLSVNKILRYSLLIVVVAVSFLFSPQPKDENDFCGQYIHLGTRAGFVFNCDAADYCMNAADPTRMLGDSGVRQSRPLFVLMAATIGHPIQWLTNKLSLPLFKSMGEEAEMYIGFYMGYIFINFLTILLSLLFFESIAVSLGGGAVNGWILLAFQIMLVSNEVTKAFFFTAHQQFFSLLTPLITIWLALRISSRKTTLPHTALLSLACGTLMLLYGNFLTMFGTLMIVAYLSDKKLHLPHLLKNVVLFLLPTALWIGFCIYLNGHYYNHEVARFRQLVWMQDALNVSAGHFFTALWTNIQAYFSSFGEMHFFIIAAMLSGLYLSKKNVNSTALPALQAMTITGLVLVLFFMILGFYEERLTYTLLPVCLCIIYLASTQIKLLQKNGAPYVLAAIAWHLYNVLSYGPFS